MSLDISNIVASRICHDIISPIGAIHNGLELISMTASLDAKSPEMALIHDSCQDARADRIFPRGLWNVPSWPDDRVRKGAEDCECTLYNTPI